MNKNKKCKPNQIFDWSEYLTLAEEIIGIREGVAHPTEARQRAAISRAYYAAHVTARNFLKGCNCKVSESGTAHGEVINLLTDHPERSVSILAEKMKLLHGYRNKADYDDTFSGNLSQTTTAALKIASRIVQELKPN